MFALLNENSSEKIFLFYKIKKENNVWNNRNKEKYKKGWEKQEEKGRFEERGKS